MNSGMFYEGTYIILLCINVTKTHYYNVTFNIYVIQELLQLGQGGMGLVWRSQPRHKREARGGLVT